ncbi:MAG: galactose-1-phosphate uridylyltransferase [Dictyoglomus sp. NZ13-RE01]|nr:MAG: galactose-1-phosphate uridylyltransferase [Dictyoglomus sp. NZ13-RE01]
MSSELRWHPFLKEWVIVAGKVQERPVLPAKNACPLCYGGAEVPKPFDVAVFENRYPSLTKEVNDVTPFEDEIYKRRGGQGVCEVVLYTMDHDSALSRMPLEQIEKLVLVWEDRYKDLSSLPFVEYVQIFENRGEIVGVSLHHPHGQIYAMPFIPPIIEKEINSAKEFWNNYNKCLFCSVLEREVKEEIRVVYENKYFVAFMPYYGKFPFELHIYPKRHLGSLVEMTYAEKMYLAEIIQKITKGYDNVYGYNFSYMMLLHQKPSKGDYPFYHFHIEFYSLHRDRDKIKYLASIESGTGTFVNPLSPEDSARLLRDSIRRLSL